MKLSLTRTLGAFALAGCALTAHAVSVNGILLFGGGTAILDNPNLALATKVVTWNSPTVTGATGDFTSGPITFTNNWTFNSGINPLWVTGGYTFVLTSSAIQSQTAVALVVSGTGIVTGNGKDATTMNWTFTTQMPDLGGAIYSWSASGATQGLNSGGATDVLDGGTTVLLLGSGLVALGFFGRRRKTI